jgi:transcriptional regulator with XRE-family HTH domain
MARNFKELQAIMGTERMARVRERVKEEMTEMLLGELRRASGMTQEELAAILGIKQPSLSRLESQDDMQISTLHRLVRGLGGELEIIVHLPNGAVRIRQFEDAA